MKKNPCGNMQVWMKNICKYLYMPVSPNNINVIETKTQMGIELLLSESRVRVFKIEDELKYIYENEEMDSGN